ncbi:hypothetical protein A2U01_0112823, partial [Trifolium medium]|nr:hypothetical protein [Trifolium medium]
CFGKSLQDGDRSSPSVKSPVPKSPEKTELLGVGSSVVHFDTLTEFRHALKKVELPTFNGDDPAGWISRA